MYQLEIKACQDFGFHAVDFRFQVLDSGFRGTWLPDSNR